MPYLKILNIGSLNMDHVYQVDHFVQAEETLPASRLEHFAGGKGLNQSIACARAGAETYHAGFVGQDGVDLVQHLKEAGVHVEHIHTCEEIPTGHAIIQVDKGGQNCILLYSGANSRLTKDYIDAILDKYSPGNILLLQNETNGVEYAIESGKRRGFQIALNLSPVSERLIASPALSLVTWFLINEVEGQAMSGESQPERICEAILDRFQKSVIVLTLGKDGAILARRGRPYLYHKAFSVQVVDTTAAGDTFAGYFLAGISRGFSEERCLEYASRAAALAIGRKGASSSIPTWEEVVNFKDAGA